MTVTKYSVNGKDFVIFIAKKKADRAALARKLCHRQNGVGADGMVVLLPHETYDFEWEFYNFDGSKEDMCADASRCAAHFAHEKGISKDNTSEFLTGAGVMHATVNGLYVVTDMVKPDIQREDIQEYGETWWLIDTGAPHLVAVRANLDTFDREHARVLCEKYNANVNICKVEGDTMYVGTYERGFEDETLVCGMGVVACFIRNHKEDKVPNHIKVHPASGDELYVSYEEGVYRFGGKVTKTFVAETFI